MRVDVKNLKTVTLSFQRHPPPSPTQLSPAYWPLHPSSSWDLSTISPQPNHTRQPVWLRLSSPTGALMQLQWQRFRMA